jgi:hypothetical protein
MQTTLKFQGITRYQGQNQQQLEARVRNDFKQRDFINAPGLRQGEAAVLTGNDMVKFMKDSYDITIPPELMAIQNQDELLQAMFNGSPETKQAIGQVIDLAMSDENENVDAKVFAYADARQAAGSDIDGQPIVNITV